jgi:hypothetical protein
VLQNASLAVASAALRGYSVEEVSYDAGFSMPLAGEVARGLM